MNENKVGKNGHIGSNVIFIQYKNHKRETDVFLSYETLMWCVYKCV